MSVKKEKRSIPCDPNPFEVFSITTQNEKNIKPNKQSFFGFYD